MGQPYLLSFSVTVIPHFPVKWIDCDFGALAINRQIEIRLVGLVTRLASPLGNSVARSIRSDFVLPYSAKAELSAEKGRWVLDVLNDRYSISNRNWLSVTVSS
jgi:hypothetical protein